MPIPPWRLGTLRGLNTDGANLAGDPKNRPTPMPCMIVLNGCGFRCNWSSDSGGNWSRIPVGCGPVFEGVPERWTTCRNAGPHDRNGGPDHRNRTDVGEVGAGYRTRSVIP